MPQAYVGASDRLGTVCSQIAWRRTCGAGRLARGASGGRSPTCAVCTPARFCCRGVVLRRLALFVFRPGRRDPCRTRKRKSMQLLLMVNCVPRCMKRATGSEQISSSSTSSAATRSTRSLPFGVVG